MLDELASWRWTADRKGARNLRSQGENRLSAARQPEARARSEIVFILYEIPVETQDV